MSSLSRFERFLIGANRLFGRYVPQSLKSRLARLLLRPDRPLRFMNIDIVGTCNLRCPSCPVGNMGQVNPSGLMDPEHYERIVRKARDEHRVFAVGLFNWGEPMLHPRLAEFVRITKRHGLECHLSSNLNILRNIDDVLAANPDYFRISLSGFTQATYGTTHVRGDIEQVKRNMRELSEARRRVRGCRTRVTVYFHKYRDNLQDRRPMREYATSLGFEWLENWAYYMPLERVLELVDGTATAEAREFVETKFALPIVPAIREAKRLEGDQPCTLLQNQLTLDHRGNVNLCCAVYDFDRNRLGAFLDMSETDLERATNGHPTCDACASRGLHRYFTYSDSPALKHRFEELTAAQLKSADVSGPTEPTLTN